jgi:hypothetical protein
MKNNVLIMKIVQAGQTLLLILILDAGPSGTRGRGRSGPIRADQELERTKIHIFSYH